MPGIPRKKYLFEFVHLIYIRWGIHVGYLEENTLASGEVEDKDNIRGMIDYIEQQMIVDKLDGVKKKFRFFEDFIYGIFTASILIYFSMIRAKLTIVNADISWFYMKIPVEKCFTTIFEQVSKIYMFICI